MSNPLNRWHGHDRQADAQRRNQRANNRNLAREIIQRGIDRRSNATIPLGLASPLHPQPAPLVNGDEIQPNMENRNLNPPDGGVPQAPNLLNLDQQPLLAQLPQPRLGDPNVTHHVNVARPVNGQLNNDNLNGSISDDDTATTVSEMEHIPRQSISRLLTRGLAYAKTPAPLRGYHYYQRLDRCIQRLEQVEEEGIPNRELEAAVNNLHVELCEIQDEGDRIQSSRSLPPLHSTPNPAQLVPQVQSAVRTRPHTKKDIPMFFDGRAGSWLTFRKLFEETFGHTSDTPLQKLNLLAEAAPKQRELIFGCSDYQSALKVMGEEYETAEKVQDDLLVRVRQISAVTPHSSRDDWSKFYQDILGVQRRIPTGDESMKQQIYRLLRPKLNHKLEDFGNSPCFEQNLAGIVKYVKFQDMRMGEKELDKAYVQVNSSSSLTSKPKSKHHHKGRNEASHVTAATVTTDQKVENCSFCGQQHLRKLCPLKRPERRANILKKSWCLRCVRVPATPHSCNGRACSRCPSNENYLVCLCSVSNSSNTSRQPPGTHPPQPPKGPGGSNPQHTQPKSTGGFSVSQNSAYFHPQSSSSRGNTEATETACVIEFDHPVATVVEEAVPWPPPPATVCAAARAGPVFLPTLKLYAINNETNVTDAIRGLIDYGSSTTFISESKVVELGLPKFDIVPVTVSAFAGLARLRISYETELTIQSVVNPQIKAVVRAYVMTGTLIGRLPAATAEYLEYAKQHNIYLSDYSLTEEVAPIDILFGQDILNDHFLLNNQPSRRFRPGMAFVKTRYGWVLQGSPGGRDVKNKFVNCAYINSDPEGCSKDYISLAEQPCLCHDLSLLFHDPMLEDRGSASSRKDWADEYSDSIQYDASTRRFTVPLTWYNDERPESNLHCSRAHAYGLRSQLIKRNLFEPYNEWMLDLLRNNYAELVDPSDEANGHNLKHFLVRKESSETTPNRPVFNASFALRGKKSLNQCIFKGVWDQVQLVEILIRWRVYPYALLVDIRKAFLQVQIRNEDRKYVRFVWFYEGRLRVFQMKSLLFGASASPFILYAVIKKLFTIFGPDVIQVVDDTFMDDQALLAESLEALKKLLKRVTEVMAHGSFQLHKWTTLPQIADQLGLERKTGAAACLGVRWNLNDDSIGFNIPKYKTDKITRRALASAFGKSYDPLGILGPFHTRIKILFRDMITEYDWDQEIEGNAKDEAISLLQDLLYMEDVTVPRLVRKAKKFEYWCFGDASNQAYGICIYLFDLEQKEALLLLSRGHIAPKNKTIPQLELMAAVLLVETFEVVQRCFPQPAERIRFFTDSQITWHRLHSDPNKHDRFVSVRVSRISRLSSTAQWYYIPTEHNPADLISRGCSLRWLPHKRIWFEGPQLATIIEAEEQTQRIRESRSFSVNAVNILDDNQALDNHQRDKVSYSALRLAMSILVNFMGRYVDLAKRFSEEHKVPVDLPLLIDILIWKRIQALIFPTELATLRANKELPSSSPLAGLQLGFDSYGLLRLDRRLGFSDLDPEQKYPLVVVDSPIVRSYILFVHTSFACHAGVSTTKTFLKQAIYLPRTTRTVTAVINSCKTCLRYRTGKPFSMHMAPIPAGRVTFGYAFQVIGMDISGPIFNDLSQLTKYYVLIFVCAKSRAVHLELIESREASAIIRAFQRYTSVYGAPREVISDNELSFKKLSKVMQIIFQRFQAALVKLQHSYIGKTKFSFNTPLAPWHGGFYERMIGTFKSSLDRARLASANTFERLETVIREAQRYMNSRPILDSADTSPLTPAHLVFGRPLETIPPVKFPVDRKTDDALISFSRLQVEMDQLWRLWSQDYLLSLRNYNWKRTDSPKLNELVIIKNDKAPRSSWEMGVISRIVPGKDGFIRTAYIKPLDGSEERLRSIHRLIPIERSLVAQDVAATLPTISTPTAGATCGQ